MFTRCVGYFGFLVYLFLLFLQSKQDTWTINGDETGVTQHSKPLKTKPDSLKCVRGKKTCFPVVDTAKHLIHYIFI